MSNSWLEKYKPTTSNDDTCNTNCIYEIKQWLNNFDKYKNNKSVEYKPNLLIHGNHGIGKTVTVNLILKEYNYDIITYNFTFRNNKNISEVINKIINNVNIINLINNESKKQVIFIDEIETLITQIDKNFIMSLLKINDTRYLLPIIFVSNNKHTKILSEIKKKSVEIKFFDPQVNCCYKIINNIINKENIYCDDKDEIINIIIEYSQNDIRKMILLLQDLYNTFGKKLIQEDILKYINIVGNKDLNINLFKASMEILYNFKTIDDCLKYYHIEKVLLPLMILHNYNLIIDNTKYLNTIIDINEHMSKGDIVENYIYGEQIWDNQDIHGFYSCIYPSYILSNIPDKLKNKLTFTMDLNKTSIKNKNKKNIIRIQKYIKNINIIDILYISELLMYNVYNKNIKYCIEILKKYNIEYDGFESLLKLNKLYFNKIILTPKQKKDIIMCI